MSRIGVISEFPLSQCQTTLWLEWQKNPQSTTYHCPFAYELNGLVDVKRLRKVIAHIIQKYAALRTTLQEKEGVPYQVVHEFDPSTVLEEFNAQNQSADAVQHLLEKQVQFHFDLYKTQLSRFVLIKVTATQYYFIAHFHHIIFDGSSGEKLFQEITFAYNDFEQYLKRTKDEPINEAEDWLAYENNLTNVIESQSFWDAHLENSLPYIDLMSLTPKKDLSLQDSREICLLSFKKIKSFAKNNDCTVFQFLLAIFSVLLHRYTHQEEIVLAYPSNLRPKHLKNLFGYYVGLQPIKIHLYKDHYFEDVLGQIRNFFRESKQYLPYLLANQSKQLKYSNFIFGKSNYMENAIQLNGIRSKMIYVKNISSQAELSLFYDVDSEENIELRVQFSEKNYNKEFVKQLLNHFKNILNAIIQSPHQAIQEIILLTPEERNQLLMDWNKAEIDYQQNKTIHQLFEEQVDAVPNNIAVIYEGQQITYQELNEKSNKLAHYLKETYQIKPDDLVALCLDRSAYILVAILAVLKAGAAYVPMDSSYPDERIKYILEDTKARAILINEIHHNKFIFDNHLSTKTISIDSKKIHRILAKYSPLNPDREVSSHHLAYVIYTSGTTGQPKGVLQTHNNVIRLFTSTTKWYGFNRNDVWTLFHSYIFDFSIWEIWGALFNGGKLVVPNYDVTKNLELFYSLCCQHSVTVLNQTPSVFYQLMEIAISQFKTNKLHNLRYVIFGGEALNISQLTEWFNYYSYQQPQLINMYGITETTVHVTYKLITDNDLYSNSNIGRRIPDQTVYVLDERLSLLPIGVVGELYIGGAGLAREYLNRPELTAEKFITNPFQSDQEKQIGFNDRLYKSGDLVRWQSDGSLEYIGRNDFQVKIRGYRIELGEIEACLSRYADIKQCAVLAYTRKDSNNNDINNKYLVGYYVAKTRLDESAILSYLGQSLPEYMIPSILVYMEKLPSTINGKLDRNALPAPELTQIHNYTSPRNELEKKVCEIFAEVLRIDANKVGITHDFFSLGGDSIISIQVTSKLRQKLALNVSINDIFTYKSIGRLFDNVISKSRFDKQNQFTKTEQDVRGVELGLLPIQQWFFEQRFSHINYWNQSFLIKTPKLDLDILTASISKLIEFHDGFKLRYKCDDNKSTSYTQYYTADEQTFKLNVLNIDNLDAQEGSIGFYDELTKKLINWQNKFNIESGPLYSIGYIYGFQDASCRIFFSMHHLIVDTVSWRILTDDLYKIYKDLEVAKLNSGLESALCKPVCDVLGAKGSSYRQWIEVIAAYKNSHLDEVKYWEDVADDYNKYKASILNLTEGNSVQNNVSFILSNAHTQQLLVNANNSYHTQISDLLLTAFSYALCDLTNSNINYIVLEGHGREEIDNEVDISRTLGWFTTMYPVRLEIELEKSNLDKVGICNDSLGTNIKKIKEILRSIPNKGIGYGAIIDIKKYDLPKIYFNYLGQFDKAIHRDSDAWSIVGEESGLKKHAANLDAGIININGMVINGILHFYITTKLNEIATNKLAVCFKRKLEDIVAHTSHLTRSYLTITDVEGIISQKYLDKLQRDNEVDHIYFANSLQQGFIYHALYQGNMDDSYQVQVIWNYHKQINAANLKIAWEHAVVKFPSLRLRFGYDEELVQIIDRNCNIDWEFLDVSTDSEAIKLSKINNIQIADRKNIFNLKKGNLFRVHLIKQNDELYTCIFSSHHAILDGWSNQRLFSYIHNSYLQLNRDNSVNKKLPVSIDHSYVAAQLYLQQHGSENDMYWRAYIGDLKEYIDLSGLLNVDNKHINLYEYKQIYEPKELELKISVNLFQRLKTISQKFGFTLNAVVHYAWHKLLSIYSNTGTTVVGTTVSGRNLPIDDIDLSVGLYINTLPSIVKHIDTLKIIDIIRQVQLDINETNGRSNVNLAKLQKNAERLFNTLYVFENYPTENEVNLLLNIEFVAAIEKLDYVLCLMAQEKNNNLSLKMLYAGELFSEQTIVIMIKQIEHLIDQIIYDVEKPVSTLQLLYPEQYQHIIYTWNSTNRNNPSDKTIYEIFEEQVEKAPNNVAIKCGDLQWTYTELNILSNQLANYLRTQYQVMPDDLIGICLDRSELVLIAILGVLKSGGAYVPIDPDYPDERIAYILNDTNTKVIITNNKNCHKLEKYRTATRHIIVLDDNTVENEIIKQSKSNSQASTTTKHLAYVIYTSGTTGNPKGVLIEHKSIVNYFYNVRNRIFVSDNHIVDYSTNIGFDLTLTTTICSLCSGYTVSVYKGSVHEIDEYQQHLMRHKVTVIKLVPSYFELLTNSISKSHVNIAILGGEKVSTSLLRKLNKSDLFVYDEYGPTETTVGACLSLVYSDNNILDKINTIGKPYSNYKAYVLDENLNPLPVGAIGELYIGGLGLARGYLNQSDLTNEKFILNPYQSKEEKDSSENTKIYKTGDRVRWLPEGNLEYIGRNDFQIKLRGFRIELGEIEAALLKHGDITNAIVMTKSKDNVNVRELIAYIVASEFVPTGNEIKQFLQEHIPFHMIPDHYVVLEKLPLTINGKIDRKALSEMDIHNVDNYIPPRDAVESQLCKIWAEVLELPEDKVGIQDDFFKMGGDSILAIRLVSKINQTFSVQLKVKDIFLQKTIIAIRSLFDDHLQHQLLDHEPYVPFSLVDFNSFKEKLDPSLIEDIYPASYLQVGMLLESSLNDHGTYHAVTLYKVNSLYDEEKFISIWNSLVVKHELLRASFLLNDTGNYCAIIYKAASLDYQRYQNVSLEKMINQESKTNFDLTQPGLFRLIVSVSNDKFDFIFSSHHAIEDGWSVANLINEFVESYKNNKPIEQISKGLSYGEYIQCEQLAVKDPEALEFWKKYLADAEFTRSNWKFNAITSSQEGQFSSIFSLTTKQTHSIHKLAKVNAIGIDSIFLYAYLKAISLFLNTSDITIGLVVNNRLEKSGGDKLFGLFLNTIPFRFKLNNLKTIEEELLDIFDTKTMLYKYKYMPYAHIKSLFKHDLYEFVFNFVHFHILKNNVNDIEAYASHERTNIPLSLSVIQKENTGFHVMLKGHDGFIDQSYLDYFSHYFQIILSDILNNQQHTALDQADYHKLIKDWNNTNLKYPDNRTIQQCFEEQVIKSPNNLAIVYEDIRLSYHELNSRANQLAHYIKNQCQIKSDDLILVCLSRSEHLVVAVLAILKTGAAYVPMDPDYPTKRLNYIIEDTNAKLILANEIYQNKLTQLDCITNTEASPIIIAIDSHEVKEEISKEIDINLNSGATSKNLAYVIYTSGTTGQPKGVMIEHAGVINCVIAQSKAFELAPNDDSSNIRIIKNCLWYSNYVFDAHVSELYTALLNGHVIYIIDDEARHDVILLADYIKKHNIAIATLPPALLTADQIIKLETLIVAGEKAEQNVLNNYIFNNIKVINAYGPSEGTVCTSLNYYNGTNGIANIGKPIQNIKCYILDNQLNLLPIGVIGELYISGAGLARGYLNQALLTAERFISNPYQNTEDKLLGNNTKLYKTGDLVRWLPDGNLEFISRNDFQVKIHGFRIELGEIQNILNSYDGIKQAVVLAHQDKNDAGNKYLVAYYVSNNKLDELAISAYLSERLPQYMLPKILIHLQSLPLTINGKVDQKMLPEAKFTFIDNFVAPRNELEAKVCAIYAETLGLETKRLGIKDDFFSLGGDSIISIRLVSKLRQKLNLFVNVKDIFTYKCVERLYDNVLIKAQNNKIEMKTEQGLLSGNVDLLPIQEWFFASNFVKSTHWNQSFMIKVPALDIQRLEVSIYKLIYHHDVFRLRYKIHSPNNQAIPGQTKQYIQYYTDMSSVEKIKVLDIDTLIANEKDVNFVNELNEVLTHWQSNFNLEKGPLYSIGYIHGYADGTARVYFALHHLLVDAVSWQILTNDLRTLYEGNTLSAKSSSYRQWVSAINNYKNTHIDEVKFWSTVMYDYNLTKMMLENLVVSENTRISTHITLTQQQTMQLLHLSSAAYHTQINDLLLTALAISLSQFSNNNQPHVNHIILEGHGREEIADDLDITTTLGWFTTRYPIRLMLENLDDIGGCIKIIKENLRAIPHNGIGYGALIGYHPLALPHVSFNYLGQLYKENSDDNNQVKRSSLWKLVAEASGISIDSANQDHAALSINGYVANDILNFHITSKLSKLKTELFTSHFKRNLETVINHTISHVRSYLTISDVDKIISADYLDNLQHDREIASVYLANSLQQGFIYHELNQGELDDAYRVQVIWQYQTNLNILNLKRAWEYAQIRYSTLRLRFAYQEELVQIIDKVGKLDWRYIDLSEENDASLQEMQIKHLQEQDRKERYNLNDGNLFRIYLIKQKANLYTCIFSNHHAILDGWSNAILLTYVHSAYIKLENEQPQLIDLSVDYSYEEAQKYLQQHNQDNYGYWSKYIGAVDEFANLNGLLHAEHKKIKLNEYKHVLDPQEQELILAGDPLQLLKNLSGEYGVTLNAILQYVWHKLLSIYGNTKQTIVGMTVSGRSLPIDNIESSVGLYINTLPLIVNHSKTLKNVIDVIQEIQANINEVNDKSNVNLANLHHGGERLFDSLFVYENYPKPVGEDEFERLNIRFKLTIEKLDYPLVLIAYEANHEFIVKLKYAGELFKAEAIVNLLTIMKYLLEQITNNPLQLESKICGLDDLNYQKIIYDWNNTSKTYPQKKTIQQLFEEQVNITPNNIAVVFEETQLTYNELNIRSNQLAHYLQNEYYVKMDDLVALCFTRSEYMLIAILAVLKAGGAYVPLDPNYPDERIKYILEDTQVKVILINEEHTHRFLTESQAMTRAVLAIDDQNMLATLASSSSLNPYTNLTSHNLAYVIYTSGTTGQPKGVMVEHINVINTIYSLFDVYDFSLGNKCTAYTSYVFDVSVSEFFTPLFRGSELHIFSESIKVDPDAISNYLLKNNINYVYLPPILLTTLPKVKYSSLIAIIYAGEACDKNTGRYWSNNYKLYNYYGPTEATIYALGKQILNGDVELIGRPIQNVSAYVLDENLNPLPVGTIGELYIGGAGIARGYLNQPQLTAERFITNSFQSEFDKQQGKNERLYKTGDLVRFLANGNVEYIGRNDFQVKIRGYRIELAEIEAILGAYPKISQCVVVAYENTKDDGRMKENKYLVCYYVSINILDDNDIISYIAHQLPEYMIPSLFIPIDKIPLTINGKLDRSVLPSPQFKNVDRFMAPRNELENRVCSIYAHTLGISGDKFGVNDDFFRLGGDSILSIQLVSKIRKQLGINISVKDVFSNKTIKQLFDNVINKLSEQERKSIIKSEQGNLSGKLGMLPIQEWFFEQQFAKANHWNQSFMIKTPLLDIEQLTGCLNKLVTYHDAFKLRYKKADDDTGYSQYYAENVQFERLQILDLRTIKYKEGGVKFNNELNKILTSWQNGFDLIIGPLHTFAYIYGYKDNSARIYFALHHLIVDAVSWRILIEDLNQLYMGMELDQKRSSYRQWVNAVRVYGIQHNNEKSYWLNVISSINEDKLLGLLDVNGASARNDLVFSRAQTKQLLRQCNKAYNTQINDLLLTALAYALFEITQNELNHIVLEGHGREEIDPEMDVSRTVGWFTTMFPVQLKIYKDLGATIKHIKEYIRHIPNKGIGFGALIGLKFQNLPKVSFNYLGQFDKDTTKNEKLWSVVDDTAGDSINNENIDANIININGLVLDSQLKFTICSKLDRLPAAKFTNSFKDNLERVINHCANKAITEYTMSDFDDYESHVVFNEDKPVRLFMLPPGNGGAESYFDNLVPLLSNLNLTIFNNFHRYLNNKIGNDNVSYMTYENLAHDYIRYIKKIQPIGPYHFFGWSFGGVLAFEIARQLTMQGDIVDSIILVDSYFDYKKVAIETSTNHVTKIVNSINYKYQPVVENIKFNPESEIVLFKALKYMDVSDINSPDRVDLKDEDIQKITKYYTECTNSNYLDNILENDSFKVFTLDVDHESWIKDKSQLTIVCNAILDRVRTKEVVDTL